MDHLPLKQIAIHYSLLPLSEKNGCIVFGAINPENVTLKQELEFLLSREVRFVARTEAEILAGLKELYGAESALPVAAPVVSAEFIEDSAPSEIVAEFLRNAVELRASDIHFEPAHDVLKTRMRIDGVLQWGTDIPEEIQPAIISHIKILSGMDIAEKRRPQDGKFNFECNNRSIDVRVSTIPTVYGEKIVLRLLDRESLDLSLEHIGFLPDQRVLFEKYIHLKQGIILVTGPTGSGKTTTLYAALNQLNRPEVNIVTVEDPIEYELKGLNQTQVHPQIDYTFANALRSFLRQDPDIILVGEIRDTETAQIAIRASLTGHLVFSTVHTNSTVDTISRLVDMGVPAYLLAATLKLVVAQRLVRKNCPYCADNSDRKYCPCCRGTGYFGRIGLFELLPVTPEIQEAVRRQESRQYLQALAEKIGVVTFSQAGEFYIKQGILKSEELERVFSEMS